MKKKIGLKKKRALFLNQGTRAGAWAPLGVYLCTCLPSTHGAESPSTHVAQSPSTHVAQSPSTHGAESPSTHVAEAEDRDGEDQLRMTKGAVLLEEVGEIGGGNVVGGFVGEQKGFKVNPVLDREPVWLDENGGDVVGWIGAGNDDV